MVYGIGSLARQGAIDVSEGQGNEVATIPIGSLESERGKHAQLVIHLPPGVRLCL